MLLALVSVHGNSATATKLQTPRNISLTGDVTGNVSFDGSKNVSMVTNLANVTVLSGTISGPADSNGSYSKTISYPSGYNQSNCIVIGWALELSNSVTIWGTGMTLNSGGYASGAMPTSISMHSDNINLTIRNVYISSDGTVFSIPLTGTYSYKIILMKV